jgi:hypothetical protein
MNRSFQTSRYRREDNIKIDLKKEGCCDMDWIHLDRVQWWAEHDNGQSVCIRGTQYFAQLSYY